MIQRIETTNADGTVSVEHVQLEDPVDDPVVDAAAAARGAVSTLDADDPIRIAIEALAAAITGA